MVNKVKGSRETAFGFNAATGQYEDLMIAGIMDPAKVSRIALVNAASVAALMLATHAMIAEHSSKGDSGTTHVENSRPYGGHGAWALNSSAS